MCQAIQKKSGLFLTLIDFSHQNIIKYCNRPFSNVEEMNENLIENWNKTVSKKDTVIHLGDFSFRQSETVKNTFQRLNGNIHIVLGNHDNPKQIESVGFASIKEGLWDFYFYDENKKEKRKVFLCHYPLSSWNARYHGRCSCFGHIHSGPRTFDFKRRINRSYDIGVDNNEFTPIDLSKLIDKLELEEINKME